MNTLRTYRLEGGKYEIDRDDRGLIVAMRRHGEPWPAGPALQFSKVFHAALDLIDELAQRMRPFVKHSSSNEFVTIRVRSADVDAARETLATMECDELPEAQAPAAAAPPAPKVPAVFLVATGETLNGCDLYERHEGAPPPLCDFEGPLYAGPATLTDPEIDAACVHVTLHENPGPAYDRAIGRAVLAAAARKAGHG